MTRVKISTAVLVLLIAGCIWSSVHVRTLCDNLLDCVEALSASDTAEEAIRLSDQLLETWQDAEQTLSALVPAERILEIRMTLAKLKPLLNAGNDELPAELSILSEELTWLRKQAAPLWSTVL